MESDVTAVAAGNFHTCVIKAGALWCWGNNDEGQLGIGGDTPATSTPTPVQGMEDVTAISAGANHTCALRRGELLCWGSNSQGQLGDPTRSSDIADKPSLVPGMRGASSVSAGGQHTCALRSEQVWCWGDNLKGQVGEGGVGRPVREPRRIIALEGISSLSAGLAHTCAIQNGMPWCWGNNVNGQLGNNSFADSAIPALLDPEIALGVSAISAGHNHTCAIHFDELHCWGSNTKNQTGNGDVQSPTPAVVDGFNDNVTTVAAGANHTCAAREGEVWCWGDNSMQQISASDSPTEPPRRIFLP
jgi:alpha-tubulin suppressor-like RCC1 family protein